MWSQSSLQYSWRNPRLIATATAAAGALLCSGAAWAGEAGRIVFVTGQVHIDNRSASLDDAVNEGQAIKTGADGYVYVKTVDSGLLILRPSSHARIVSYRVDRQSPSNTQVKFELLSGVARSVSGTAVKDARQNFRFNTPVAAIGVRGTDFTVSTDQETSNVTVLSGAIVVSGFSGACLPAGGGPCEHAASRELAAGQAGQMLRVSRGEATPQLLNTNGAAPDVVSPPRKDEPGTSVSSKPAGAALGEPALDAQKTALVIQQVRNVQKNEHPVAETGGSTPVTPTPAPVPVPTPVPTPVPAPDPVVVVPEVPTIPAVPPEPVSQLVWGRWAALAEAAPTINAAPLLQAGGKRVAYNAYYTVVRSKGAQWSIPEQGTAGFSLRDSEAFVSHNTTGAITAATLQNGELHVDFGNRTFNTGFDLLNEGVVYKMRSIGSVGAAGDLSGRSQFIAPSNMAVSGSLGANNDAAYIFSSALDGKRTAYGATYWTK